MIYYSAVTPKGNSSYSYDSQEDAEAKAKYLDDHDCSDCSYCSGCFRCSKIKDGSPGVIQAGRPNSWPCYGWLKDGVLAIHCGCHNGDKAETFASAVDYWSNKPDRLEVLMACHYIASVAHSRGWRTE